MDKTKELAINGYISQLNHNLILKSNPDNARMCYCLIQDIVDLLQHRSCNTNDYTFSQVEDGIITL